MANRFLNKVLDWLALLGLTLRESKHVTVPESERRWGQSLHGFALSAYWKRPNLYLALKNTGSEIRTLQLADWSKFFQVRIDAPLNEYGRRSTASTINKPTRTITLRPGEIVEADLPIERLYELKRAHKYATVVTCDLGISSNPVEIVV